MSSSDNTTRAAVPLNWTTRVTSKAQTITTEQGFRGTKKLGFVKPAPEMSELNFLVPMKVLDTGDGSILFVPQMRGEGKSYSCYTENEVTQNGRVTHFRKTGSDESIEVTPGDHDRSAARYYLAPSQSNYFNWEKVKVRSVKNHGASTGGTASEK
jgi:hypothetical protein